jgi:hypothetical protein
VNSDWLRLLRHLLQPRPLCELVEQLPDLLPRRLVGQGAGRVEILAGEGDANLRLAVQRRAAGRTGGSVERVLEEPRTSVY